jgi:hypothetical protein
MLHRALIYRLLPLSPASRHGIGRPPGFSIISQPPDLLFPEVRPPAATMLAASPRPTLALDPRPTKSRSPSATPISMTAAQRQPPSPSPSPTIPRKRALEDDEEHKPATSEPVDVPADIPRGAQSRRSRVTCELCSQHISFSDDATGGFTMRHWDAHRARW